MEYLSEKYIENKLVTSIKKRGGVALKILPCYWRGAPDRVVLMPCGRIFFVELKSPRGRLSKIQALRIQLLVKMGFNVYIINSLQTLEQFLSDVQTASIPAARY